MEAGGKELKLLGLALFLPRRHAAIARKIVLGEPMEEYHES